MKILMVGDTHSAWDLLWKMYELENPDLIIHCGDWGSSKSDRVRFGILMQKIKIPLITIYGNHDDITLIREFKGKNNYHWLPSFQRRMIRGINFMGINGNIAGRVRNPWHVTENIIREELRLCSYKSGQVDFIVSHECPKGYADIIKSRARDKDGKHIWKKHSGWESLFEVLDKLRPRFWLCGHIHFPQIGEYKDTIVFNTGYGAKGNYMILDTSKDYKDGYSFLSLFRSLRND